MAHYEYAYIRGYGDTVTVITTNPETIQKFLEELEKATTTQKLKISFEKFHQDEPYCITVSKVKNLEAIYVWMLKQMCHEGWEPFSQQYPLWTSISLRKCIE